MDTMKKTNKFLVASAVAIMLAPAALSSLPQNTVSAAAVGTVSTATPVYDANGKANGTTLPSGSQWQLGQQITLNGVAHYQVGNNEYVPASVITNVTGAANSSDNTNTVDRYISDNPDAGKVATAKTILHIVDAYGNETGAVLASGSQWTIGSILHANKMTYYQVATNEFIPTTDVTVANASTTTNTNTNVDTSTNTTGMITTDAQYGKTATMKYLSAVFDNNGNKTGLVLPANSQWRITNMLFVNGQAFYQIATNEWISDVDCNVTGPATGDNGSYIMDGSSNAGKTGTVTRTTKILTGAGIATGSTLAAGTQWKLGSNTLFYDKQTYVQVASNEYVSAMDMNINDTATTTSNVPTPGNGLIATTKVAQRTYNTATNSYDMNLAANTAWKISKLVVNKYGSYWGEIGTNQWVWISNVTLNSGLNLKANSYYEPEFATSINK